jgi:hypothetical protein
MSGQKSKPQAKIRPIQTKKVEAPAACVALRRAEPDQPALLRRSLGEDGSTLKAIAAHRHPLSPYASLPAKKSGSATCH